MTDSLTPKQTELVWLDVEVVEVETLSCGHHNNPQFVGTGYEGGACPWCGADLVSSKCLETIFRDRNGIRCSQSRSCDDWGALQQVSLMFCLGSFREPYV